MFNFSSYHSSIDVLFDWSKEQSRMIEHYCRPGGYFIILGKQIKDRLSSSPFVDPNCLFYAVSKRSLEARLFERPTAADSRSCSTFSVIVHTTAVERHDLRVKRHLFSGSCLAIDDCCLLDFRALCLDWSVFLLLFKLLPRCWTIF